MDLTSDLKTWLPWVIRIRFVIISFVFAIDYAIQQLAPASNTPRAIVYLGIAVILWYVLNLFFLIYNQISRDYVLQAHLQIYADLVIITAIVHVTGDLDSNYFSLYLVAIILASILLPRSQAFLVAGVSFILMGLLLEMAYLPTLYPNFVWRHSLLNILATTSPTPVDLGTLQVKIGVSLFGFFAVAYLSSFLADSLRKTGAELRDKSGQVASLQAINENIIRSMRDGLITTDLEGTITDLNPAGEAILGRSRPAMAGRRIVSVFPDAKLPDPFAERVTPDFARAEINYWNSQGKKRILGLSASPLIVPEIGTVGCVYTVQDLTMAKKLEAEYRTKDRMATLGRLSAGIAHEIRNPLASIAGSAKVLQSLVDGDEDQRKLIGIVSQESERLNKLVSDFLLYSREQRFEFRELDVVALLEETVLLLTHNPNFPPSLKVEKKFPGHAARLVADADKLRQVFWNLCDNAVKAMGERGVLTLEVRDSGGEELQVIFSDTGMGFYPAQMEKLFEPFQSGFRNGTGLGLAIVYQIIRGHGGNIRVDSAPNQGTRFTMTIPKKPAAEVRASLEASSA
jgi:two-component system sensor histidine kinase PilS (NtrC family)